MKILHNNKRIFARIRDSQWTDWAYYNTRIDGNGKYWMINPDGTDNVHVPLDLLDQPEDETNRDLNRDLLYTDNSIDDVGEEKYTVDKGVIKEKASWTKIE